MVPSELWAAREPALGPALCGVCWNPANGEQPSRREWVCATSRLTISHLGGAAAGLLACCVTSSPCSRMQHITSVEWDEREGWLPDLQPWDSIAPPVKPIPFSG